MPERPKGADADADADAGGRVSLNGHLYEVTGIAVTAAKPSYPNLCNTTVNEQQATNAELNPYCPKQ